MKYLLMLTLLVLSLSACSGASTQGGQTCQEGICIRVRLAEPIRLNESVTAMITVQTERDVPGLRIFFPAPERSILVEGEPQWTVNAQSRKSMTTNRVIRFTEGGFYQVMAYAQDPLTGTVVKSYVIVHITDAGGKVYLSGTPLPITPFVMKTPPPYILNPQGTPLPIPTRAGVPPTPTRRPYP